VIFSFIPRAHCDLPSMLFRTVLSVVVSCDLALAQTLWATHYDGTVSKLALTSSGLKVAQKQTTCGAQPSWLTYDNATKILYCLDEAYWGGSLSAFTIGSNGLSQIAKVNTLGNGVYSSLYGGDNGDSFLAIAH
jgi:6-phosphogluconolactonase (cycloisomerase 2 family)